MRENLVARILVIVFCCEPDDERPDSGASRPLRRLDFDTKSAAAEAVSENRPLIAAAKRCATQNQLWPYSCSSTMAYFLRVAFPCLVGDNQHGYASGVAAAIA